MRLLERSFDVETEYGGGFVQSLEGLTGGRRRAGTPVDWFYYVNGVEAVEGAASRKVSPATGSGGTATTGAPRSASPRWSARGRSRSCTASTASAPAHAGVRGEERPCDEVEKRLTDEGVEGVSRTAIGNGIGQKTLRDPGRAVGRDPRATAAARSSRRARRVSGVYAIPRDDGIELLDEDGEVARDADRARRPRRGDALRRQQPTWIVTGTDDAGVAAAAAGLRAGHPRATASPSRSSKGARRAAARPPDEPMIYRRRPSPLHAARAAVGALWCLALVAVALVGRSTRRARRADRGVVLARLRRAGRPRPVLVASPLARAVRRW